MQFSSRTFYISPWNIKYWFIQNKYDDLKFKLISIEMVSYCRHDIFNIFPFLLLGLVSGGFILVYQARKRQRGWPPYSPSLNTILSWIAIKILLLVDNGQCILSPDRKRIWNRREFYIFGRTVSILWSIYRRNVSRATQSLEVSQRSVILFLSLFH